METLKSIWPGPTVTGILMHDMPSHYSYGFYTVEHISWTDRSSTAVNTTSRDTLWTESHQRHNVRIIPFAEFFPFIFNSIDLVLLFWLFIKFFSFFFIRFYHDIFSIGLKGWKLRSIVDIGMKLWIGINLMMLPWNYILRIIAIPLVIVFGIIDWVHGMKKVI